MKIFILLATCAAFLLGPWGPVHQAQAIPRTFVSGTGSGLTCSRTVPCAAFQIAVSATDDGGEINCLDAGDFGAVIIDKNITIDCAGTAGTIFGVGNGLGLNAVTINTANVVVRLRNLSINGGGVGKTGIRFLNGAALFVENCVIANFNGGTVGDGIGIKFAPPAGVTAELHVKDSIVTTNGRTGDGGGIVIQPAGDGSARVAIDHTRVENNTFGIFANGTGTTGTVAIQVRDSVSAANVFHGISSFTASGKAVTSITVDRSSSIVNGATGILAQGAGAFVLLTEATVISNQQGLNPTGGGGIFTYQDNQLTGNVSDGAPSAALTVK